MRRHRVDDLTPPEKMPEVKAAWGRRLERRRVAGRYEAAAPDGGRLDLVYCALADVLPGLHLGAFAPADWTEEELAMEAHGGEEGCIQLTPRECEVLQLAAEGLSGPSIAERLVVSPGTVKTHFGNVYAKLGVSDRAAAVARGLRLGLID
jgi:DNA-binding CsgD family transcriptional regulator